MKVTPELVEKVAARTHNEWVRENQERGLTSVTLPISGDQGMVPFENLSEASREHCRYTVRAVLEALSAVAQESKKETNASHT